MRKIFIDIGAYDGKDSRWFIKNNPDAEIYAFECDKRNIETIKSKKINALLIESAAWIYDGEVEYFYGNPDGGTLLSSKKTGGINPFNYYSVPCIDFAKFMKDNFSKDDHITIKMNCEGSEYQLINHIKRTNLIDWVDKWYIDWHWHKIGMQKEEHEKIAGLITNNTWPLALTTKMTVSVIIPYKEDRGWLQQSIDSVPEDCELILSQGDGNCQQNFNNGIKRATGDLIRWLHDDDRLTPNCIKDSVKTFQDQDCDFIHGNAYQVYEGSHQILNPGNVHGRTIPYIPPVKFPTLESQLVKNVIHSMTTMYKRDVFEKVGYFDESLIWSEEIDFHLKCLKAGLKIGYCNSFLAYYRIHQGQKSNADQKQRHLNREMIKNRYR